MSDSIAHPGLGKVSDRLDDLWIEIGKRAWCPCDCRYCFSEFREDEPLSLDQIMNVLEQFRQAGGRTLAIPGAGEPFHPRSRDTLFTILDYCRDHDIQTTIFTEGSYITDDIADKLMEYPTARFLIKCNSRDPKIQDDLVRRPGYTRLRDAAIQRLIDRGFADQDDSRSRVGIVTSVMTDTFEEVADLLRYARQSGLIFDCDTIIDRGRGSECGLKLQQDQTRTAIEELQRIDREEFGRDWEITSTYVGSPPCTRFSRHLYVRQGGIVHPCVGTPGVVLGDVREQSLQEIWDSEVMRIIRDHKYVGPCTSCRHFQEEECYSCLGRRAPHLTTEDIIEHGAVPLESTCFNYRGE